MAQAPDTEIPCSSVTAQPVRTAAYRRGGAVARSLDATIGGAHDSEGCGKHRSFSWGFLRAIWSNDCLLSRFRATTVV